MTWIIALSLLAGGFGMYRLGKVIHSCCKCESERDNYMERIPIMYYSMYHLDFGSIFKKHLNYNKL